MVEDRRHVLPVRLAPDRLVHQRQPVRDGHLDHRHLERRGAASRRPAPTPATRRPPSILPVAGSSTTSYVFLGDRWNSGNLTDSRYVWEPLTISGTTASMTCQSSWTIDTATGTVGTGGGGGTGTSILRGVGSEPVPGRAELVHDQRHADRHLGLQRRDQPVVDLTAAQGTARVRQQVPRRRPAQATAAGHQVEHLRLQRRHQPAVEHQRQRHHHRRRSPACAWTSRRRHRQRHQGRDLDLQRRQPTSSGAGSSGGVRHAGCGRGGREMAAAGLIVDLGSRTRCRRT